MKIKYRLGTVLGPIEYNIDITDPEAVSVWREFLKRQLLKDRPSICDCGCGEKMRLSEGIDMHEGIITKNHTQGLSWQPLIYHEFNCFLVKHNHHLNQVMVRGHFFNLACVRYGTDAVVEWLNTLPFKTRIVWPNTISL